MTKTKQAGRSTERPGQPKENPSGMPYGTGSIQMRGRSWWMIYRDVEGRTIQENTRTEDQDAARRMLAERAIITLEAQIAALREVLHEGQSKGNRGASGRGARQRRQAGAGAKAAARDRKKGTE